MPHKSDRRAIRLPIRRKLFLLMLGTILLPLLLLGTLIFHQLALVFEQQVATASQRELTQMAERMNIEFSHISALSNQFYLDEDYSGFLSLYMQAGIEAATDRYDAASLVKRYNAALSNINFQVALIAPDGKVFGNPLFISDVPYLDLEIHSWHQTLTTRPAQILWVEDAALDALFSSPGHPYVYLVRRLQDRETWEATGTLIIGISELELKKMYLGYMGESQSTYLLSRERQLISYADDLGLGAAPLNAEELAGYSGSFILGTGAGRTLVGYHTINQTQWVLVNCWDMARQLSAFSGVTALFAALMALYLLITITLSSLMAKRFVEPINTLYASMRKAKEGDLKVRVPLTTNDEIAEVSSQFNAMLGEIEALMDDVVLGQKLKREAEILSLQTQINPHFLYNTLASVRYLVFTGDKQTADEVILALIRLMKNTLSDANEFVPVEREVSLLNDYIGIQRLAFGRPLEVSVCIPPDVQDKQVIKLLLQPVVENAILHGLKPKKEGDPKLTITAHAENGALTFTVQDNGVGFEPGATRFEAGNAEKRSIGLKNVHDRLRLTFGEGYGMEVHSRPQQGTRVTLRMPLVAGKGEYSSYEHPDR